MAARAALTAAGRPSVADVLKGMSDTTATADTDLLNGFDHLGRLGAEISTASLVRLVATRLRNQLTTAYDYSETGHTQDRDLLASWSALSDAVDHLDAAAERHERNVIASADEETIADAGHRAENFEEVARHAFETLGGRIENLTQAALTGGRHLSDGTIAIYAEGVFAD